MAKHFTMIITKPFRRCVGLGDWGQNPKYNWGDIPIDIAAKIRDHLELYDDYEAFSVVCSSWRLVTKEFRRQYINRNNTQLPMLILADDDSCSYRRYYSLTKTGFLKIEVPPCIPAPQVRRYFSSRGWLISVTRNISKSNNIDNYFNITIFNPFSNNSLIIEAPLFYINALYPIDWEDARMMAFFWKFDILTYPDAKDSADIVVAVIYGESRNVAYWRHGHDHKWVLPDNPGYNFRDLCFFQGELYATQCNGFTAVCKVISFGDFKDHKNSPQTRVVANLGVRSKIYQLPPDMEDHTDNYYLVESKSNESDQAHTFSLLVIMRYIVIESYNENKYKTMSFNVFKVNVDNGKFKKVKSLENKAIFVGFNSTFCMNAVDGHGCKSDCIYYTEDCWQLFSKREGGGSDMGIYSLQGGNIVPFNKGPSRLSFFNAPTWIELTTL